MEKGGVDDYDYWLSCYWTYFGIDCSEGISTIDKFNLSNFWGGWGHEKNLIHPMKTVTYFTFFISPIKQISGDNYFIESFSGELGLSKNWNIWTYRLDISQVLSQQPW